MRRHLLVAAVLMAGVSSGFCNSEKVYDLTPDISPPGIVSRVEPEFPEELRAKGISGEVVVRATISAEGDVERTEVVKKLEPQLDRAAETAIRQWRFRPAVRNGKPVAVRLDLTVHYIPQGIEMPGAPMQADGTKPAAANYLVLLTQKSATSGELEDSCATIHNDGSFRFERHRQRALERTSELRIIEGSLSETQLAQLKALLASPELVASKYRSWPPPGVIFREGKWVNLYVPRDDIVQHVSSAETFGTPGSLGGNLYMTDPQGHKLVNPISKWIHDNVEKSKAKELKGAQPQCGQILLQPKL